MKPTPNSSVYAAAAGARPPTTLKQPGIPLIHLLLASENPTRLLARVLASPRFQTQLVPVALFLALGIALHVYCHALRTALTDLEKRRKQLAWLARLMYTYVTLAMLVYTTLQPGWLGLSLLVRAVLMGVHLVLKTVADVVSGEVDERVLRGVAQGHVDVDEVRHPGMAGAHGGARVLRVSPSILLLVREHEDESLVIRFRRSLSSGAVLVNEPPAEILLVQRTGRVVSMDDLLMSLTAATTRTSSQVSLGE